MIFYYKDKVKILIGFYRGRLGTIIGQADSCWTYIVKLNTRETVIIHWTEMERLYENKKGCPKCGSLKEIIYTDDISDDRYCAKCGTKTKKAVKYDKAQMEKVKVDIKKMATIEKEANYNILNPFIGLKERQNNE